MDDLVVSARAGGRAARRLVPLACLALTAQLALSGCTTAGGGAPGTEEGPRNTYSQFITANGLLYPPELWQVLSPSTVAAVLRHQTLRTLGESPRWTTDPAATYRAMSAELNPVEAAYLLQQSGVLSGGPTPWGAEDIRKWWSESPSSAPVEHLWMASRLAAEKGMSLPPSPELLSRLEDAAADKDLLPAELAGEMLRTTLGTPVPAPTARNIRQNRDAAVLVHRHVVDEGSALADVDPALLALAQEAAVEDDWSRTLMVRVLVAAGRADEARRVAETLDPRRLLDGGAVLEPPDFVGSLGSTFRMLAHDRDRGADGRELDAATRDGVISAARAQLDVDSSHTVAGTAILAMLEPASTPAPARQSVIDAVLAREVGTGGPLPLEKAIAWTALTGYATVMDVPVPYPGLHAHAVTAWTAEEGETSAPSIIRFLLALHGTGGLDREPLRGPLVAELQELLASRAPEDQSSFVLFGGALALHAETGSWPVQPDVLQRELQSRQGDCLGGFDDYTREARAGDTYCSLDASQYAVELRRALVAH